MKRARIMLAAACLSGVSWCGDASWGAGIIGGREMAGQTEMNAETAGRLQAVLDKAVKDHELLGIQACIRGPERKTWCGSAGYADHHRRQPLRNDHLMRVGSVTKSFTAALVFKIIEEGKLDLDDPICKWFPDFPQADRITVRHLLGHTSGIFNFTENTFYTAGIVASSYVRGPLPELGDALAIASRRQLYFPPGSGYHYSNTGYLMLGLIAEREGGKPVEELLRDKLFKPLCLENTFLVPRSPVPEMLAEGIDRGMIPFGEHKIKSGNLHLAAAAHTSGAMVSNAGELLKWFDALFDGKVLQQETLRAMAQFRPVRESDPGGPNPYWTGYGLGMGQYLVGGDQLWGHTGVILGFEALAGKCPARNYTLAIIISVSDFQKYKFEIARELKEAVLREKSF